MALRGVDLTVLYGEVHALVGQNGSGKSTLIKVLSGYHEPDPGAHASVDGEDFELGSAQAAEKVGLRFVHQDLGLVLALSTEENLLLGRPYPVGFARRIHWGDVHKSARTALGALGIDVDVTAPVSTLTLAERTGVAIARALIGGEDKRILVVLDEPTAALPPDDVNRLLATITKLRDAGNGVLLVSHHLDEVLRVADRTSVMRDGLIVGSAERAGLTHARLVELMLGRAIDAPEFRDVHVPASGARKRLCVEGLSGGRIENLDFSVYAGEVVGFAGIAGSGRESLASLLTGRLARSGRVIVDDVVVKPHNPKAAIKSKIASIPGERAQLGNFPNFNVRKNMTIADTTTNVKFGRISQTKERVETREWIERLSIVSQGGEATLASLSGGNQQKVLVARALRLAPKLLILDDPTLGVDVGAKAQIHEIISHYAGEGMAVVVVSTDSEELATLCDKVSIFVKGSIVQTIVKGANLTSSSIDAAQLMKAHADRAADGDPHAATNNV